MFIYLDKKIPFVNFSFSNLILSKTGKVFFLLNKYIPLRHAACDSKKFGANCSKTCSEMCGGPNKTCNNVNGFCTLGCIDGYQGHRCHDRKLRQSLSCPPVMGWILLFLRFFFSQMFLFFLHCFNYLLVRKYVNCANS